MSICAVCSTAEIVSNAIRTQLAERSSWTCTIGQRRDGKSERRRNLSRGVLSHVDMRRVQHRKLMRINSGSSLQKGRAGAAQLVIGGTAS